MSNIVLSSFARSRRCRRGERKEERGKRKEIIVDGDPDSGDRL